MILLTGTTGTIGQALISQLPEYSGNFRVLTRDPKKLPPTLGKQVDVVAGGFEDAALDEALAGVQRALLLIGNGPAQLDLEKRFIDRAVAAGVGHVVKISAVGADAQSPAILKAFHGKAEQHLMAAGVDYTIVRPNFFAQNLLHMASTVKSQNQFYMPMGTGKVAAIDAADVATFALTALTTAGHENKLYDIGGSELLSFHDIASQMSEVAGRAIQYIDIPNQAFKDAMLGSGAGQWHVDAVGGLFELTAKGESELLTETYEEVTGVKPTSLRDFVRANLSLFNP